MNRANILLTTAGRKSYLARIFRASRKAGKILAADVDPLSPIRHHVDHFEVVPSFSESDALLEALLTLCWEYSIDCVLPQNDMELALLASAREEFLKKGISIAGIPPELVRVTSDKYELAGWLEKRGYLYPRTWLEYPSGGDVKGLVEKDRWGQGSQGLVFLEPPVADRALSPGKVVQERIPGDEYNLDILRDRTGCVVSVSVKKKLLMVNGSTDRAVSDDSPALIAMGTRLGNDLQVFGSIDVDLMLSGDRAYVLDINPRIGGGFPFTAEFYPAYVDALLDVCAGAEVEPLCEAYQPGVVICREYTYSAGGAPPGSCAKSCQPMEKTNYL